MVVLVRAHSGCGLPGGEERWGWLLLAAYMEAPLELPISSELHAHHLVQEQAHQVEGLRHRTALVPGFGHGGMQYLFGYENFVGYCQLALFAVNVSLAVVGDAQR